jgi:hypothetical protein
MDTTIYEFNPIDYASYRFRVSHDNGIFTMSVLARNEAHGRERIRNTFNCPDCAIETLLFSPMRKIK